MTALINRARRIIDDLELEWDWSWSLDFTPDNY